MAIRLERCPATGLTAPTSLLDVVAVAGVVLDLSVTVAIPSHGAMNHRAATVAVATTAAPIA